MRLLQSLIQTIQPIYFLLAFVLTVITNITWKNAIDSYDLANAIGFSLVFFLPVYYQLLAWWVPRSPPRK